MARASGAAGLKSDRRLSLTSSGLTFEKNTKAYCGDRVDREWGGRGRRGERERIRRSEAMRKDLVYRRKKPINMETEKIGNGNGNGNGMEGEGEGRRNE